MLETCGSCLGFLTCSPLDEHPVQRGDAFWLSWWQDQILVRGEGAAVGRFWVAGCVGGLELSGAIDSEGRGGN